MFRDRRTPGPAGRSLLAGRFGRIARFGADRSAAVGVAFALALPGLTGLMAVGIDMTTWYFTQQKLQTAADAAALAGALEIQAGDTSHYADIAKVESQRNQVTNGADNQTVTINWPPAAPDANHGNTSAVQAIVTKRADLFFARMFLGQGFTIQASAVAGLAPNRSNVCILGLNALQNNVVDFTGSANLSFVDCAVVNDSFSTQGFTASGSAASTDSAGYYTHASLFNFSSTNMSGPQTTSNGVEADPFASTVGSFPPSAMASCGSNITISNTTTLSPGTYTGITIQSGANVTMSPGTYYLDASSSCSNSGHGNFTVQGGTVTGNGVTVVMTNSQSGLFATTGEVNITGGTVTMTAPTSGTYPNFLFIGDTRPDKLTDSYALGGNVCGQCSESISGSASTTFSGIIYMANDQVSFTGNSAENACLSIVADEVVVSGTATLNCTSATFLPTLTGSGGRVALFE